MMNKFLLFKDTDKEWAEFILNNRAKNILIPEAKHNKNGECEIVYGPLADGYIGDLVSDFENKDQLSIHDNKLVKQVLKHKGHIKGIGKESFK